MHVHWVSTYSILQFNRHIKVFQLIPILLNISFPSVTRLFIILCSLSCTMKILFNHVISVAVFVVFVVTSANANNVSQNPAENNQSSLATPSASTLSNEINFPVSHIEAPEMPTTVTAAETTLVTSTASTTTVTFTSTTAYQRNGQRHRIDVVYSGNGLETGMAAETQTDESGLLIDRYVIQPKRNDIHGDMCPKGYFMMRNGDYKPLQD